MKKTILSAVFALGCFALVNAQNPADLVASEAVQETQNVQSKITPRPEKVLKEDLIASLANKGKSLGMINDDGSIYVIGAATTARPSNMPGFINSRNIAYAIAELRAKTELLRMAGEEVTSERGTLLLEDIIIGEDPDAKRKATILQKALKIADKSLDNTLLELGVPDEEIQQMNMEQKKAAKQKYFYEMSQSLVSNMVKGCAVVRISEGELGNDDYQVAVCVKYSPEQQSFAYLIQNGGNGDSVINQAEAKSSLKKVLGWSEDELIRRLGTFVSYNENGEMVIYGFGQQEVLATDSHQSSAYSRAYSQARLQAVNNIKNFVAEDLVAKEVNNKIEKGRSYVDKTNDYFSSQNWELAIKSKATTLNIATEQIRQWEAIHPKSNTIVAGYVVAWTYSHSQQANKLKKQLNNKNILNSNIKRKPTTKGKITITGDDEDL